MSKKAFLGMSIIDLWSFVLLVLVIVGFMFLFYTSGIITKTSTRVLSSQASIEADSMLIGLLRYNVEEKSMVEFIVENIDDMGKIEMRVREIMDIICKQEDYCYWAFEIIKNGERNRIEGLRNVREYNLQVNSDFQLPSKDKKIIVRMIRYYGPRGAIGK